jgi:hypothetical protein
MEAKAPWLLTEPARAWIERSFGIPKLFDLISGQNSAKFSRFIYQHTSLDCTVQHAIGDLFAE